MAFPDVVVFSRVYPIDPLMTLRKFKKLGKRVIYEIDDNLWDVNPDNPSVIISTEKRRQYEHLMTECDAVVTTTEVLAKKLRKFNKKVFICPNGIDYKLFDLKKEKMPKNKLRIGYTGAASHWGDLTLMTEALIELQKKHDFDFVLQGVCPGPLEAEMWGYSRAVEYRLSPEKKAYLESALKWYEECWLKLVNRFHVPFWPPVMFPGVLASLNIDIGLVPLKDNKFNQCKSCLTFYEYATIGAVTLASKVLPYTKEVGYCCKNTTKDWIKKLEKLIVDEKFRKKLQAKQSKWVKENRDINVVVDDWEDVFDSQT